MIFNYLKPAVRILLKDRGYTFLNVLGLTAGITFSLLLLLYVADELQYDRFHTKADRIVRVAAHVKEPENEFHWAGTQFPAAATMKADYPNEVENSVRLVTADQEEYRNGEKRFREEKFYFSGETVFDIFTYPLLEGDPASALKEPNSIVLSKTTAEKYFGPTGPYLGKTLTTSSNVNWKVTGVAADVPQNTHIRFDALLADHEFRQQEAAQGANWGQFGVYTYVLLRPNVQPAAFEQQLGVMYEKYMATIFKPLNININYVVQPIADIHLHSINTEEPEPLGSMAYVRILGLTAIFLVLLACINYINLTTARATRRAREVGVRKVMGSTRSALAAQFLSESALLALFSGVLGLGLAYVLLPVFNEISGKTLAPGALFQPAILGGLGAMLVLAGFIGGSYPALVLSGFQPLAVLRGGTVKSGGGLLRQGLVVMQFAVSLLMLIATGVIYDQVEFLRTKDIGFQKEQVVVLRPDRANISRSQLIAFRNNLKQIPNITAVGSSSGAPGLQSISNKNVMSVEGNDGMKDIGFEVAVMDEFAVPTLGMSMVKGRNFDGTPGDTINSVLVNETLVKKMNWADPLGKKLKFSGNNDTPFFQVVGVIKDFNQQSLYNPIEPLVVLYRQVGGVFEARVQPGDMKNTLSKIGEVWGAAFPGQEFKYTFLDEEFDKQFASDRKRGRLFSIFSGLSILIACLGLLGLVAYTTEQRRREIGIRKVLGAGQSQVVALLARHFLILVLVAGLIAIPVAAWLLNRWLADFPYKTDLQPLTFVGALVILLLLTFITVGYHTIKAALANPVKAIRTE